MNSLVLTEEITTGITAGTTQTQAGSTALTTMVNIIGTCANDDDAIALPKAIKGQLCFVSNQGAADAEIWPHLDAVSVAGSWEDTIAGGTAGAAWTLSMGQLSSCLFIATSGTAGNAEADQGNWQPLLNSLGAIA